MSGASVHNPPEHPGSSCSRTVPKDRKRRQRPHHYPGDFRYFSVPQYEDAEEEGERLDIQSWRWPPNTLVCSICGGGHHRSDCQLKRCRGCDEKDHVVRSCHARQWRCKFCWHRGHDCHRQEEYGVRVSTICLREEAYRSVQWALEKSVNSGPSTPTCVLCGKKGHVSCGFSSLPTMSETKRRCKYFEHYKDLLRDPESLTPRKQKKDQNPATHILYASDSEEEHKSSSSSSSVVLVSSYATNGTSAPTNFSSRNGFTRSSRQNDYTTIEEDSSTRHFSTSHKRLTAMVNNRLRRIEQESSSQFVHTTKRPRRASPLKSEREIFDKDHFSSSYVSSHCSSTPPRETNYTHPVLRSQDTTTERGPPNHQMNGRKTNLLAKFPHYRRKKLLKKPIVAFQGS